MSKEVEALVMQVAENGNLIDAAIVFINGVADRIDASGGDEEKLAALTAELRVKDLARARPGARGRSAGGGGGGGAALAGGGDGARDDVAGHAGRPAGRQAAAAGRLNFPQVACATALDTRSLPRHVRGMSEPLYLAVAGVSFGLLLFALAFEVRRAARRRRRRHD